MKRIVENSSVPVTGGAGFIGSNLVEVLDDFTTGKRENLAAFDPEIAKIEPQYGPSRASDIPYSLACIDNARKCFGYAPWFNVKQGIRNAARWYFENLN